LENTVINTDEEWKKHIDETNMKVWRIRGAPSEGYDPEKMVSNVLERSREMNYTFGIAQSLLNFGMGSFLIKNDFSLANAQLNEALQIFKDLGDIKWISNALLTISIVNNSAGHKETALYNALKAFDYYASASPDDDFLMAHYIIGTVYKDLKRYDLAESYYNKGLTPGIMLKSMWNGRILAGLTNIYTEQEQHKKAIETGLKSRDIFREEENAIGESRALNDIGLIYKKEKQYELSLQYLKEGLKIREVYRVKHFIVNSMIEIGLVYIELNDKTNAVDVLKQAEELAIELISTVQLSKICKTLAEVYKEQHKHEEACSYYEKCITLSIQSAHQETEEKIRSLHDTLLKEKEQEIERLKNVELKNAYAIISERNKEVTDSINYARRIQQSLLSPPEELQRTLCHYFLFYEPKDIVSGDFYWTAEHNNRFYLAVCDSTGHGVPGAFMSLLNMAYLNEAVKEKAIAEPNEVLNYVRKKLIENISKDAQQDGMDAILICIDKNQNRISYAAANNRPLLIRDGQVTELPADKMPVGKSDQTDSFSLHSFEMKEGDRIYFYTDGYADQFGGPKNKKFKYKALNDCLFKNHQLPLEEQEALLRQTFIEWKGNLEQVDDVLIIGVKL
jgi:serine phosphatase RsbU (regulator of sigma subunit)